MILLIGGTGQGKLACAIERQGCGRRMWPVTLRRQEGNRFCRPGVLDTGNIRTKTWEEKLDTVLEDNPDVIILCDRWAVGWCPSILESRSWREAVGRPVDNVLARRGGPGGAHLLRDSVWC